MDYREVFQNLNRNEESIKYIMDYKESLKNFPNLLKKIRPEILNLKTEGEVCIYVYENVWHIDNHQNLSKVELSYLFKILFGMSPAPSWKKDFLESKLNSYISNTIRTADLIKNSCYW